MDLRRAYSDNRPHFNNFFFFFCVFSDVMTVGARLFSPFLQVSFSFLFDIHDIKEKHVKYIWDIFVLAFPAMALIQFSPSLIIFISFSTFIDSIGIPLKSCQNEAASLILSFLSQSIISISPSLYVM